jgi:hypothetical protein
MDAGAAGVMIAPPNTLRTDDQIAGYYRQAAEAIGEDVPFVVQDYPLNFSVVMTPGVIRRVIEENPSCVMLKHEDWPGLEKISALRAWEAEGGLRRVSILCGNGGLFLDFEVERGADGAMTGYAFPTCWWTWCVCRPRAGATPPTTCSTRICRFCATSSSPAWDWPSASTSWRGAASSPPMRSASPRRR